MSCFEEISDYERIEIENRLSRLRAPFWAVDQAIAAQMRKNYGYELCREAAIEARKFRREEEEESED